MRARRTHARTARPARCRPRGTTLADSEWWTRTTGPGEAGAHGSGWESATRKGLGGQHAGAAARPEQTGRNRDKAGQAGAPRGTGVYCFGFKAWGWGFGRSQGAAAGRAVTVRP